RQRALDEACNRAGGHGRGREVVPVARRAGDAAEQGAGLGVATVVHDRANLDTAIASHLDDVEAREELGQAHATPASCSGTSGRGSQGGYRSAVSSPLLRARSSTGCSPAAVAWRPAGCAP